MMHPLHSHPLHRPEDLGKPIPDDEHAVSVCLPTWASVVGYEERDPAVLERLQTGYPRFRFQPPVQRLMDVLAERHGGSELAVLPLPDAAAAHEAADFVQAQTTVRPRIVADAELGVQALVLPSSRFSAAKAYWQHAGAIVSSRRAACVLDGVSAPDPRSAGQHLRERIAAAYGAASEDVWLHPSGMAALHHALAACRALLPGRPTIQAGFPYVDVYKVQERFAHGADLLTDGDAEGLARALARQPRAACVTEVAGNPLLRCADVQALSAQLRPLGVPLIIDDTVATPIAADVTPWADIVIFSATKSCAGSGAVIAGATVLVPRSPLAAALRGHLARSFVPRLHAADAVHLAERIDTWPERVRRMNETASALATRLRGHAAIAAVHEAGSCPHARSLTRPGVAPGHLLSVELREPAQAPAFYDALAITKGPSLGCDFTLACPYTLLAHYDELDWAEAHGASRHLVRLSVGLEPVDDLWQRLAAAL